MEFFPNSHCMEHLEVSPGHLNFEQKQMLKFELGGKNLWDF